MAGIGLSLRKMTLQKSIWNNLRAYLYAGLMSSGAWVVSVGILVIIYIILRRLYGPTTYSLQFMVAVSYLVSSSLILSALFQHALNRMIADLIFKKKNNLIRPFILSVSLILIILSFLVGLLLTTLTLYGQDQTIKWLMISNFVVLNLIWLLANVLSGLKKHGIVVLTFFLSYAVILFLAILLAKYKLAGLLAAFFLGHSTILGYFIFKLMKRYRSRRLFYPFILSALSEKSALIYSCAFFYLGIWADKYCFWIDTNTSMPVLGALRASPIYDLPMFLAYMLMIPGMLTFFYGMEVDFGRYYHRYYDAIRQGANLNDINKKIYELQFVARMVLFNLMKIQGIISFLCIAFSERILKFLHFSPVYQYLFEIDVISIWLLVIFFAVINFLYYLDRLKMVVWLSLFFFLSNVLFTVLTIYLGPLFYGYGFGMALLFTNALAIPCLNIAFKEQTYFSFMSKTH